VKKETEMYLLYQTGRVISALAVVGLVLLAAWVVWVVTS
jgi:hypothetical protein